MEVKKHRFPYEWKISETKFTKDKGSVFSCFACGGGSSFGYKLAGFDVLGCNEIDPKMIEVYKVNHKPKYAYLEPIQTFKLRKDLPKELYNLDILDGSPPCSSFSMAGNREKDWGKKKKFREGQTDQVLDTLFFDFIDLAKELQPKVVVAENVKGMLLGDAQQYVREVYKAFGIAGYKLRIKPYLLDASKMGVPQKRERVFFIALRNDLAEPFMEQIDMFQQAPKLELNFNELGIKYCEFSDKNGRELTEHQKMLWNKKINSDTTLNDINQRERGLLSGFNILLVKQNKVLNTIIANGKYIDFETPQHLSDESIIKGGTFPSDYDFMTNNTVYLVGMSVPPVMTAQISTEIYTQWLCKSQKREGKNIKN